MYASFFGLTEPPFSISPDPRFLYMSDRHREALAHLLFGIGEGGGFVQLTGEVGTGKTAICRCFLEQLPPQVDVALVLNPRLTAVELLATVCDDLGTTYPQGTTSLKILVDTLYRYLLDAHERGRRTVLIIDEAQNLAPDVLEQIRLLTNLETAKEKLLQIILIGQPELVELLERRDLRQLAQRVTARYHLLPFSEPETREYVRHRLAVAGRTQRLFTESALREVHHASGGVPRLINVVCDRALLGAYAEDRESIDAATVRRAAAEVFHGRTAKPRPRAWRWIPALALGAAAIAGAAVILNPWRGPTGRGAGDEATLAAAPASSAQSETATRVDAAAVGAAISAAPPAPALTPSITAVEPRTPTAPGADRTPHVKLAELLRDPSIQRDKRSAFVNLFARWHVDYPKTAGGLGCEHARRHGLSCLFKTGTWARLRRYDLPAVVELIGPSGERQYATVTALGADTATLAFGDRRFTLALSEIDGFWDGPFILLWKPAMPSVVSIGPGARGKDIEWLRRTLGDLDGTKRTGPVRDVYDDELKERVMAFQRSRLLLPDGIVGEETLAHLSVALRDPSMPALSTRTP